jgi:predicted RecB family endonuclease
LEDHSGQEVDLLLERSGKMLAIEVKAGMTVDGGAVRTLGTAVQAWGDIKVNRFIFFA